MGARRDAREALAAAGLRPQKRFGQHFLCDGGVVRRILDLADIDSESVVVEIGPGLGALTDELARRAGRLYAVEIDRALADRLVERHAADPRVRVLVGDVLALPLADLVDEPAATVVANLPYNIGTEVVFRLLDLRARFPRAVLMLQREVAERFAAKPGGDDWGVTSVLVQTFAQVRVAFRVSRRSFVPVPNVDSAVVDIRWTAASRVDVGDPAAHRAVVRAAFGKRRKMLRNALADLATAWNVDARQAFARAEIDPAARAETLDLAAFGRLARAFLEGRDA